MKLKVLRNADEIVKTIERVIPNAVTTCKGDQLLELQIEDVHLVIGSYSVDVTVEDRPTEFIAVIPFAGTEVRLTGKTKEEVEQKVSDFNSKLAEPINDIEIKEVTL